MRIFLAITLVLCVFSGCKQQKRPDGFPDLFPCVLKITQEEKPLEGAMVRLIGESGSSEWIISGRTDANGAAKIFTHADFAGAPEGTFKVCISKNEAESSKYVEPADNMSQEWKEWRVKTSEEKLATYRYVKSEYENPRQTPHSITITKGKNEATFDVGEPIKEEIK